MKSRASKPPVAGLAAAGLWCAVIWANLCQIVRWSWWVVLLPVWLLGLATVGVALAGWCLSLWFVVAGRWSAWRDRRERARATRDFRRLMQRGYTYGVRRTEDRIVIVEERKGR